MRARGDDAGAPPTLEESLRATFGDAAAGVEITCGEVGRPGASGLTRESRVHLRAAALDLRRVEDRFLLGHEVAHAIQQRRGGEQAGAFFASGWRRALEVEADRAGASFALGRRFAVTGYAPRRVSLFSGTRKKIKKLTLYSGRGLMIVTLDDDTRESVPLLYDGKLPVGSYTFAPRARSTTGTVTPFKGTPDDDGYVFKFYTPLDADFDVPDALPLDVVADAGKVGHRIQADPEKAEVEPGAEVKYYVGAEGESSADYTFNWWEENDPRSVTGSRPARVQGPPLSVWNAKWSFTGLHTIGCDLTSRKTGVTEHLRFVQKVIDWRQREQVQYEDVARRVRAFQARIRELLTKKTLSEADFAELNQLYARIDAQMLKLRELGFQQSNAELIERIEGKQPFDGKIKIVGLRGGDLGPGEFVTWGERRQFDVDVDLIPPNVQVFAEWFVEGTNGEWAAKNSGLPPEITRQNPTGSLTLGEDVWLGPVGDQIRDGDTDKMRVTVKLRLGKDTVYDAVQSTAWLPVKTVIPKSITILAKGLQELPAASQPGAAPAAPAKTTPGATAPPPVPVAPAVDRLALLDTFVEFRLSWVTPLVDDRNGFVTFWEVEAPPPDGKLTPGVDPRSTSYSVKFLKPGPYTIRARVRPADAGSYGSIRTQAVALEASLPFRVVSSADLASKGIAALKAQGLDDYASTMRELDRQISDTAEMRRRGSPAQAQLADRGEALTKMRDRMRDELGAAPLPLPAKGPLDPSGTYVFPLAAVMAVPEAGGVVPLRIFVRLDHDAGNDRWNASLVDTTTQDVVHFRGDDRDPVAAVRAAISRWQSKNEYPQKGTVRYEGVVLEQQLADSFSTSSTKKTFWEWFDRILFIGQALLALLLLLLPEPTGATKAAGLALLAVGILRGVYRLYESLSLGRPVLDERNVLEALSILTAAMGLAGGGTMARAGATALRGEALSARALAQFQLGKGIALMAAGVDAGTFVWVARNGFAQMQAVANDTSLPEAERQRRLQSMAFDLAAQGLMLIGTNAQLFRGGAGGPRGTRPPLIEAMGGELKIDPVMRARMESTLRRLGATDDVSALEPRALLERYNDAQSARQKIASDVDTAGAVRGQGVYDPAAPDPTTGRGPQTAATVESAARPLLKKPLLAGTRLENLAVSGDKATVDLIVEIPATAGKPADTLTVKVAIEVPATVDPIPGQHGAESGMARLSISGDPTAGWRAHVDLDSRIASAADVQSHLAHELREAADIARRATVDPKLDIVAETRPRVFGAGPAAGDLSGHDRAAAHELSDLHEGLRRAIATYDRARADAATRSGKPIPADARQAGEAAYRRLDAMLDAMGFADPGNRAAKRAALLAELGIDDKSPLASYIDGYGARAETRLARTAALGRMDPADRARLATELPADLLDHVNRRLPADPGAAPGTSPVEVIGRILGRNDASTNATRNLVREALRRHREGRFSDATLLDVLNTMDVMTQRYRDRFANNKAALQAMQAGGPNAPAALRGLELGIVRAGITVPPPGAPTGTAAVNYRPEPELTTNGVHGTAWNEADARQRSVNQRAEDVRNGRPPRANYDQGKFGTPADVNYVVEAARQFLGPEGNALGLPHQGVFELPPGHQNIVYRPGNAAPVIPDVVYVEVRADGTIHSYPADRAVIHLGAVGGLIRPVVTW